MPSPLVRVLKCLRCGSEIDRSPSRYGSYAEGVRATCTACTDKERMMKGAPMHEHWLSPSVFERHTMSLFIGGSSAAWLPEWRRVRPVSDHS